ncbi:hypothetical protein POM88_001228 [Heracleum sosnowskyi]|uniref:Uncharacterized protein n=1 Tax=Heracleum sosnowskyi TaxID=360622 RepID=A0AAD8JEH6_9APIA|nr:hypothetical protein POM88_001228 [Heracleum sosnowskyi]
METDGSKQKQGRIICLILCLVGDSNLFKEMDQIIANQIEPLTEQQLMGICGLQQSTQEAEEALSQGLDALNQSLSDVIVSDSLSSPPNMANYMGQMAMAMSKLSTLEASFYSGHSPQLECVESCKGIQLLNMYLKACKDDVNAGVPGKFLHAVLGQDACDVGSVVSTIMYSFYLHSSVKSDLFCTVPVINMKRADLNSHA